MLEMFDDGSNLDHVSFFLPSTSAPSCHDPSSLNSSPKGKYYFSLHPSVLWFHFSHDPMITGKSHRNRLGAGTEASGASRWFLSFFVPHNH